MIKIEHKPGHYSIQNVPTQCFLDSSYNIFRIANELPKSVNIFLPNYNSRSLPSWSKLQLIRAQLHQNSKAHPIFST